MNCLMFTTVFICMTFMNVLSMESRKKTLTLETSAFFYHFSETMLQRFYNCLCGDDSEVCIVFFRGTHPTEPLDAYNVIGQNASSVSEAIEYSCTIEHSATYLTSTYLDLSGLITCSRMTENGRAPFESSTCQNKSFDVSMAVCNSVKLDVFYYGEGTTVINSSCAILQSSSASKDTTTGIILTSVPTTTGSKTTAVIPTTTVMSTTTAKETTSPLTAISKTASQSISTTAAGSTSRSDDRLLSTEEDEGANKIVIIIAASVGFVVIIVVIVITFLLLRRRRRRRMRRRKPHSDNDVNDNGNVFSNNVSSSTSQPRAHSNHNGNFNTSGAEVEMSSYAYATVIPSTERKKFQLEPKHQHENLPSSNYCEVMEETTKSHVTDGVKAEANLKELSGRHITHGPLTSADTGAYSEVQDTIIKNDTPNVSYSEIDLSGKRRTTTDAGLPINANYSEVALAPNGISNMDVPNTNYSDKFAHSSRSNDNNATSASSSALLSGMGYAKLHDVKRNRENPYDTFSVRQPTTEENDETEHAVSNSAENPGNEYSQLHEIRRQEQNPYNVLPATEVCPTNDKSLNQKANNGKRKAGYSLAGPSIFKQW